MNIEFYGIRGSYTASEKNVAKYGINTSCVSFTNIIDDKIDRIIIDCGTGAISLGKEIIKNYFAGKEDLNILMLFTHAHPDHTQGFTFFAPNYFSECNMRLMGMFTNNKHIGTILKQTMLPPTFPIEYKDLKSKRKHYILKDGMTFRTETMMVKVMKALAPSHPQQGALYYKITDLASNKSVACIWDIESKIGGDIAVAKFAKECDIMIHDTQYTTEEYNNKQLVVQGFGHSTYEMAIENAAMSEIKENLICTHLNPVHNDGKLDSIQDWCSEQNNNFEIILAYEGLEVELQ